MKCSIDGCYAKSFSRCLCRGHYALWRDHLDTAGRGVTKGVSDVSRAPTTRSRPGVNHRDQHGSSVCVCATPDVISLGGVWAALATMCQRCGKPPAASLTLNPPERII